MTMRCFTSLVPRSDAPRWSRWSRWSALRPLLFAVALASCNSDSTTGSPPPTGPLGLPAGSFDIGIPASVAVRRGGSTELAVTISRTAFVAPVFITLAGLPTGVVAPVINSTSTNQLRIPISADSSATLGPKTVEVTAMGGEAPTLVRSFVLTVSSP